MRCSIITVVLLSALVVGCAGPGMPTHYRVPGVDGPGPGVLGGIQPMSMSHMPPMGAPQMGGPNVGGPNTSPPHPGAMPQTSAVPRTGSASGPYQQVSLTMRNPMAPQGSMHGPGFRIPTSQINFLGVEGLRINFDAQVPGTFDSAPLIAPAAHDFPQGATYRLKLSNIPGHPGKELYPTIDIAPTAARTQAFLAHSSVPVEFTDNDFDQVFSGNFVTKVVYLPNPEFQGIAMSGVGTLVSTRLPAGADPIIEASKRGSILAVVRMGNKDLSTLHQQQQRMGGTPMTAGMPMGGMHVPGGMGIPQNPISGVNIPRHGTPMTRTTTGIPGPPQLPQDMNFGPNRGAVLRAEPIPAPPATPTFALPGH